MSEINETPNEGETPMVEVPTAPTPQEEPQEEVTTPVVM